MAKMDFGQKKLRETDLLDFTRFFDLDFLNFFGSLLNIIHIQKIQNLKCPWLELTGNSMIIAPKLEDM